MNSTKNMKRLQNRLLRKDNSFLFISYLGLVWSIQLLLAQCGRFEAALKTTERDLVERCLLETLRDSVKSELRVRREVEFQTRRPRCLRAWGAIIAPHFPEIYSFDTVEALDQWVGATLPSLQDGKITRVDISDLSKLRRTGPFGDSLLFSPLEHYVTPIPAYRYQRTPSGHFRRQLRRYASGQDL